jgi:hypothetical protein
MPTLILTPRFTEDAQALWGAAGRLGWDVERLPSWRVPEHLRGVNDPVLYVEVVFAPTFAEFFKVQLREPPVDWLPSLPHEWRMRNVELSTMGEARKLTEPAFIKPPNDKSFPAKVYRGADLPAEPPDDTPVLVSEIVEWEKEFRCYILDRKLRTFSIYLRDGELQRSHGFQSDEREDAELTAFVERMLADDRVKLDRAAVIEVGVIRGRGWAVLEQNAAWGAGIYGCDPTEVLQVLRHACVPI